MNNPTLRILAVMLCGILLISFAAASITLPKAKQFVPTNFLSRDQNIPLSLLQIGHVDLNDMPSASNPDHDARYYTQDQVNELVAGSSFDFFFSDNASLIADYNFMFPAETGEAESSFTETVDANGVVIATFITEVGQPTFSVITEGVYEVHIHASATVAGDKDAVLFWELWERDGSGNETLLISSEETIVLTAASTQYDIHGNLLTEERLDGNRLVVKVKANLATMTGNDPDVTIVQEGITDSRILVRTTIGAFDDRYWLETDLNGLCDADNVLTITGNGLGCTTITDLNISITLDQAYNAESGSPRVITVDDDYIHWSLDGGAFYIDIKTSPAAFYITANDFADEYIVIDPSAISGKFRSTDWSPLADNAHDLGYFGTGTDYRWKDLLLAGNLSDGTNAVTVANIADMSEDANFTKGFEAAKFFGLIDAGNVLGINDYNQFVITECAGDANSTLTSTGDCLDMTGMNLGGASDSNNEWTELLDQNAQKAASPTFGGLTVNGTTSFEGDIIMERAGEATGDPSYHIQFAVARPIHIWADQIVGGGTNAQDLYFSVQSGGKSFRFGADPNYDKNTFYQGFRIAMPSTASNAVDVYLSVDGNGNSDIFMYSDTVGDYLNIKTTGGTRNRIESFGSVSLDIRTDSTEDITLATNNTTRLTIDGSSGDATFAGALTVDGTIGSGAITSTGTITASNGAVIGGGTYGMDLSAEKTGALSMRISNSGAEGTDNVRFTMISDSGDVFHWIRTGSGTHWAYGVDQSDGNKFKWRTSSTISGDGVMELDRSGNLVIDGLLDVAGGGSQVATGETTIDLGGTSATQTRIIAAGGATSRMSLLQFTGDTTPSGYGIWMNFNAYYDNTGTQWRQPRTDLASYLFTVNNHKQFSWLYAAAENGTNDDVITPAEIATMGSGGTLILGASASSANLGSTDIEIANLYLGTGRIYVGNTQAGSIRHDGTYLVLQG